MGGKRSLFYFKVHSRNEVEKGEPKVVTKYFTSGNDVAKYVGCCRSTVFKMLNEPEEGVFARHFIIERCEPPIPYFQLDPDNSTIIS